MTNNPKQIVEFVPCSCNSEAIQVSRFTDETDVYLAMFEWRHSGGPSFLDRVRHAWRILRRGYATEDDLILKGEDAQRLAMKLIEFSTPYSETRTELSGYSVKITRNAGDSTLGSGGE